MAIPALHLESYPPPLPPQTIGLLAARYAGDTGSC